MAQPLCAPLSESWIPNHSHQQPPLPSDGDSVCSPAWSSDSWDGAQASSPVPPCARPARRAGTPGRRGTHGSRLGSGQRQSASEREKLRMRTLARALHELRRFLPPSVAPTGQNLTKIETLRLAIRYIGHLSAVLGLSEDSLRRQRHAVSPRGCPLCPDGGVAQAQSLGPRLSPAAYSGVSWGSPPAYPRPRVAAESWDPSFLYAETASQERQEMEPNPSSPVSNPSSPAPSPAVEAAPPTVGARRTAPRRGPAPLLHAGSPLRTSPGALGARTGREVNRQGLRMLYLLAQGSALL